MHLSVRFILIVAFICTFGSPSRALALERLCDTAFENCRTPLLDLIRNETIRIDVAFWFMEDSRYVTAIVERWKAGVPVRLIVDPRSNSGTPANGTMLKAFADAGIPMRKKSTGGILHWKMMLFGGQNVVEFSGANFTPPAFTPFEPYINYVDEAIYFTDDPAVVNSFKTKYDDIWTATTGYTTYANITAPLTREYPTFVIDPAMNFPPGQDFANRSVKHYNLENTGIDSIIYRITDRRHSDALIKAAARNVPVRIISEPEQYRDETRLWHAWNIDRMYAAGIKIRHRKHAGLNHEKLTMLYGQGMTIFGSSNWSSASANSQLEHNYFTTKAWFLAWSRDHFERKWNNLGPAEETQPFVPLPPGKPVYVSPSDGAQNQPLSFTLRWHSGFWAHKYDVYLGTNPTAMTLVGANLELGPSDRATDYQTYTLNGLSAGTTYYWQVVSKTMANVPSVGAISSFRTSGDAATAGVGDVVLYASKAPTRQGWSIVSDTSAAGGARIETPNAGAAKMAAPLANPTQYFEMSFLADAGVAYHLWIRGKAAGNQWASDSAYVQFSDSVTAGGVPAWRIDNASGLSVTIEDCSGCGLANWGWNDNAHPAGAVAEPVYFAASGTHTIRVQVREDGLGIDQIVLSRGLYLDASPGLTKNDGTILQESGGSIGGEPPPPPPPPPDPDPNATDIVLHTATATPAGSWMIVDEAGAASGKAAVLPDAARAKVVTPLAAPLHYFEMTFTASAHTPYRLWVRGRALNNVYSNDSVHVQFTDSIDTSGNAAWRIGSTTSAEVNLEDCSGCGNSGWGWEDNGWGTPTTLGPEIRFSTAGVKTIRVQNREDGFFIDQIVLSPTTYRTAAPGANKDDNTILTRTQ